MEIITKILEQLNSSVFVLLMILFVVGWGIYHIGRFREIFLRHDKGLDCASAVGDRVVTLEAKVPDVAEMNVRLIRLEGKVELIYQHTNPNKVIQAHNPLSLTDLGKSIAGDICAEDILKRCMARLEALVNEKAPKNAYDIQMAALLVVREKLAYLLTEEELLRAKDEAYRKGMILEDVLSVVGILLRNALLEKNNMPIADVDKHQPPPPKPM